MKKKFLALLLMSALTVSLVTGCGSSKTETPAPSSDAGAPATATTTEAATTDVAYNLIAGHTLPDAHPYNLGLVKMGELMKEKSNGQLNLDVFGNAQLGSERDLVEGLQLGSVQVTCISTAPLSGFTDMFLVFDLPFLFETTEQARAVLDSEVGGEILNSVKDQGLIGLTWFENGFRNITNNKKAIEKPEDLKGMKIRTMENQMHMAAFLAMGADPTPMAMGEVFTALQQGTIDGQENPVPIIDTNKFYEVQKYTSLTGHLFSPAPVFMGMDYFSSLPADLQTIVLESAEEAKPYEREQIDAQNISGLENLTANGMEINEPDKLLFKEATKSIYDEYIKDGAGFVSPEIYNRVEEVIATAK